jgi:hypothetical protein
MPVDSSDDRYRVVAIRSDGTQVVLATELRIDRARALVDALSDVSAFSKLEIQRESAGPADANP